MKTGTAKIFAGVLAAAICLGWPGGARAFWTEGGEGGGALAQLGITADSDVNGPQHAAGSVGITPAPVPAAYEQNEIEITEDAPDAAAVCKVSSGKPAGRRLHDAIVGALDKGENKVLRAVLDIRALRQALLRRWSRPAKLYRFVQAVELKNIADNGWAYDLKDPRNMYKFATPHLEVTRNFAKEYGDGAILEIDPDQAIPYYEISRIYFGTMDEYIVLMNGKEKIRPVEFYHCGSATAGP